MKLRGLNNWTQILQTVIENYNNTKHSSINMTPQEALFNAGNAASVNRKREDVLERQMLKETRKFRVLNIGDKVRISNIRILESVRAEYKAGHLKGFQPRGNWSEDVFTIERIKPKNRFATWPLYTLEEVEGDYKREELLFFREGLDRPHVRRPGPRPRPPRPHPSSSSSDSDSSDTEPEEPPPQKRVRKPVDHGFFVNQ